MRKYKPWKSKKLKVQNRPVPQPIQVVTKWVTITEKNGQPGKRKLRVKIYKAIPAPTPTTVPRVSSKFKHDATVGLGGNIPQPFHTTVLNELGPSWFQYGGGGVS